MPDLAKYLISGVLLMNLAMFALVGYASLLRWLIQAHPMGATMMIIATIATGGGLFMGYTAYEDRRSTR